MEVSKKIEESSTDSFIAGDDDQGIYKWNGAHVNTFINLEGTREILEQSHLGCHKNLLNLQTKL